MSLRDFAHVKPTTREQIVAWVDAFLGFKIHSTVRCDHVDPDTGRPHQTQLDYIAGGFLNEFSSCVFMAARNAGKSYAAAILCLLDCWFKSGIKIAVAAFQRNQSDYIYVYLCKFLETFGQKIGEKLWKISKDEIAFHNGSSVRFFSGGKSQAGIKGYHPNILIVDEGDLFSQEQFDGIANALEAGGDFQRRFDVLSTNYTVSGEGVVLKQIERLEEFNKSRNPHLLPCRVFRVCLLDILVKCDDRFQCNDPVTGKNCPLFRYCQGKAKNGDGFYKIESAFETMRDSSLQVFESQMLLLRPSSEFSYFHNFSVARNVVDPEVPYNPALLTFLACDPGGSRCPHAALLVQKDKATGIYTVIDEFLGMGLIEGFIDRIKAAYPRLVQDADVFYDPAGARPQNTTGSTSYAQALRKAGFFPRCKQLKRRQTFELIYALIEPATGPAKLRVNKRCKNLIAQIQAAEHEVKRGKPTPEPSNEIQPDDLLDCLRYVVGWTCGSTYARHNGAKRFVWI